jgi:Cu/Ag efflux pump CusA
MARLIEASCEGGVVTVSGRTITAEILSQGVESSLGVVILDGDKAFYIANSHEDIKEVIEDVVGLIDQVQTVLTGLDGVTVSPGSQAAAIAQLGVLKDTFESKAEALR